MTNENATVAQPVYPPVGEKDRFGLTTTRLTVITDTSGRFQRPARSYEHDNGTYGTEYGNWEPVRR